MSLIITNLSLAVWVVGLLMFFFVKHPKISEVGKLMFFAGLFVWLQHAH